MHIPYRPGYVLITGELKVGFLMGQPGLVNDSQPVAEPFNNFHKPLTAHRPAEKYGADNKDNGCPADEEEKVAAYRLHTDTAGDYRP